MDLLCLILSFESLALVGTIDEILDNVLLLSESSTLLLLSYDWYEAGGRIYVLYMFPLLFRHAFPEKMPLVRHACGVCMRERTRNGRLDR